MQEAGFSFLHVINHGVESVELIAKGHNLMAFCIQLSEKQRLKKDWR